MSRLRRVARPALEEAIQLLRDSSDWNPALKSAVGGLAFVLSIIRLRSDNFSACAGILRRIIDVARDLANQPQDALNVRFRLERFERCLLALTIKLRGCQESGVITGLLRAQRDAVILRDCESELNAAVMDMQLFLVFDEARRGEALRQNTEALLDIARQNRQLVLNQSHYAYRILDVALKTHSLVLGINQDRNLLNYSVLWRIELFSLFGQRCALLRTPCGRTKVEADASIVLFG